jgi:Zn-dependent peptidase ImmA (M78 family)
MSTHPRVTLNNPSLLHWARTSAGLSADDVAARLGTTPGAILRWEDGDAAPTFHQLEAFAQAVSRSVAVLYLPEPPTEPAAPRDFRRVRGERRGVFSPRTLLCFRQLRNALDEMRELVPLLGAGVRGDLPYVDREQTSATEAARLARELLGIPLERQLAWRTKYEALDEWRSALFDHGVLVQQFPLDLDEARGFSIYDGELAGIGVSSKDVVVARIFSIFHEVGHLLLREPGVSGSEPVSSEATDAEARVERYCNTFAAEFVLPGEAPEVQRALRDLAADLSYQGASRVARRFWVSKYTLALTALHAGVISRADHDGATEEWSHRDERLQRLRGQGGPDQPRRVVSRHGKRFTELVLEAVDRAVVGEIEATRMLGVRSATLEGARAALA